MKRVVRSVEEAAAFAQESGLPLRCQPEFSLDGGAPEYAWSQSDIGPVAERVLARSPTREVTVERVPPESVPLTQAEALAMRSRLAQHYGEPVRPVSEYCAAFNTWTHALQERAERRKGTEEERDDRWVEGLQTVLRQISKSSFLDRLIYQGEKKRTRMCPVHKGTWSGLQGDPWRICLHGCDNTGWLPEDDDPRTARYSGFVSMFRELPVLSEDEAQVRVHDAITEITRTSGAPTMAAPQGPWLEQTSVSPPDTEMAKTFVRHGLFLFDGVLLAKPDGGHQCVRAVGCRKTEHGVERLHPQVRIVEPA